MKTAGALKAILLIVGFIIGTWQGFISLQTIFVMRHEWLLLIALIIGPLSIIPAVVVSIWRARLGGWWLISAGIAFFAITIFHEGIESGQIESAFFLFALPIILLGLGLVWVAKTHSR
jgi:hypothetical protein